jgi:hypothetical protein
MPIATDDQGNLVTLEGAQWVPAKRAKDPNGTEMVLDAGQWRPVPGPSLADVLSSPEAQQADIPQSQAPAKVPFPTSVSEARTMLEPPEGFNTSSIVPLMPAIRKTQTSGQPWADIKFDIGGLRPALQAGLDLLEGTGQATSAGGPNAPLAGTVSPEATGLLTAGVLAAPGLRFGGRPQPVIPPNAFAPREPMGPPPPPPAPEFVPPNTPGTQLPRILELIRRDEEVAANKPSMIPPRTTTDPVTGATAPIQQPSQNAFAPKVAAPPPPTPQPVAPAPALPLKQPTTAAEARDVASTWYQRHEDAGGAMMPTSFTNNFIDTIKRIAPQTEEGLAIGGETEVTKLISRAEALRDKPISLAGAQEIDEALGNLIDKQYGVKGLSKEGEQLLELQTSFREQLINAAPAGDAAAPGAVEALKNGRAAWSQYQKMRDLERIRDRAALQDHPDTGIRAQIRSLLDNPRRSRGYTDEERAALSDAAKRGIIGGALHVFGSRLVPLIAGGSGLATGGLSGMLLNAAVAHPVSSAMRAGATGLANRRVRNALSTLGEGVPMPNVFAPPP